MGALSGKNILVGIGGGIAAYKCAELVRRLRDQEADIRVVMTQNATAFITPLTLQAVSGHPVRTTLLDSEAESGMDHIALARWADEIVIAPTTANVAARLANGMADDLLTTLYLASEARTWLVPAMNHVMWRAPATQRNFQQLLEDGVRLIGPDSGDQVCGETGSGRMSEPSDIVLTLLDAQQTDLPDLAGVQVLLTAGPTWEPLDPVRGITNLSSGKMGYAVAEAFCHAGASVTLVTGPCSIQPPAGALTIQVQSALDMLAAVQQNISTQNIFVAVAAVADYRPDVSADHKMKKTGADVTLKLIQNPDILATVARQENRPFCVGFAAETRDVREYALDKLKRKNLDMIAANLVGVEGSGFMSDDNALLVLSADAEQRIGPAPKNSLARQLVGLIAENYETGNSGQNS